MKFFRLPISNKDNSFQLLTLSTFCCHLFLPKSPQSKTKQQLGILEGKASVVFADDFKMTEAEFLETLISVNPVIRLGKACITETRIAD